MKRQNVRTLSLVVCTFTYLLVGAAVFDALESETERKRWNHLLELKAALVRKYSISEDDYRMMEVAIIENKPHKAGPQWKFAGAFYFSTVVLAMIGYGHSTPVTIGGKAFCMAYAMVGIPLGLIMFQSIGERLNKFASVVIRRAKQYLKCKKEEATEMNLMFATGLLSSVIITTGAAVFSKYEGWSYFDSFYYCFVTLTTIGFGDYVALQNNCGLVNQTTAQEQRTELKFFNCTSIVNFILPTIIFIKIFKPEDDLSWILNLFNETPTILYRGERSCAQCLVHVNKNDQALTTMPGYVALSLVFILFGLAVVAASINLLVLRFMTMNAEEVRREDNELQGVSQHVITVDGEAVTSVNGKLLAGHTIGRDAGDDVDQVSVCSCTCVGPVQYDYNRDIRPAERAAANAAAAAAVVYNSPPTEQPLLSLKRVSI